MLSSIQFPPLVASVVYGQMGDDALVYKGGGNDVPHADYFFTFMNVDQDVLALV
jgi:hypothetical protein